MRTPLSRVQELTAEVYPGADVHSLRVFWARNFPTQQSVNMAWSICALCLLGAVACLFVYRRLRTR